MIDAILIQPNSRASAYGPLARFAAVEPPVWAGLLATFLLKKGYGVEILDAHALNLTAGQIGQAVADAKPRVAVAVAYGHQPSASTQTMPAAREALRAIRQHAPWTPTAILGGHPSALPERTLKEEPVDFVVEGEGPYTLAALLAVCLEPVAWQFDYDGVPGLWGKDAEGSAYRNDPAPLVKDLDAEMPGVAWGKLPPLQTYRTHNWHALGYDASSPFAALYTTLNCPYSCSFCMIASPFGGPGYQKWSPALIGAELEYLVGQGVRHVKIVDEMHWLDARHVEGLADEILRRGLGDSLNLWAYARVDTVKRPDLLDKARRAGYRWLALGIEAADSHVRDGQDKDFSDAQIVKTVRAIQDAGIHVIGNYIFGLPGDTLDSMRRTLDLALELRCEWANFYPCMIYPGSRLYAETIKAGKPVPEHWAAYAPLGYECVPYVPDGLTAAEVLRFRDMAFLRYFGDPEYLAMMLAKFGQPAVADILAVVAAGPPKRKIFGH